MGLYDDTESRNSVSWELLKKRSKKVISSQDSGVKRIHDMVAPLLISAMTSEPRQSAMSYAADVIHRDKFAPIIDNWDIRNYKSLITFISSMGTDLIPLSKLDNSQADMDDDGKWVIYY